VSDRRRNAVVDTPEALAAAAARLFAPRQVSVVTPRDVPSGLDPQEVVGAVLASTTPEPPRGMLTLEALVAELREMAGSNVVATISVRQESGEAIAAGDAQGTLAIAVDENSIEIGSWSLTLLPEIFDGASWVEVDGRRLLFADLTADLVLAFDFGLTAEKDG
jgi:hypothetical protein